MMTDWKKLILNWRVIFLITFLAFSIIAIHPSLTSNGAAIRSVEKNSSAELAGIANPKPNIAPMSREKIIAINNEPIADIHAYADAVSQLRPNQTVLVKTNKALYRLNARPEFLVIIKNETFTRTITELFYNETLNQTVNVTRQVTENKKEYIPTGKVDLGLNVYPAPTSNLRKGLELQGGTRVILQPQTTLPKDAMDVLISSMEQRLNVYGISDVVIRPTSDLSGNQFVLVEIAGANEEEVKNLISQQGKFEAKIGGVTTFSGGKDITYVCRSADCSGINPQAGCSQYADGFACGFRFAISLSPGAAKKHAEITRDAEIVFDQGQRYLSKNLDLYLDDQLVDTLRIGAELKGREVTDISISGSGTGKTQPEAVQSALQNMKRLQTILITGSLPVKMSIVKTDAISPVLGEEFTRSALIMGFLAMIAVTVVIFIKYRIAKIVVPIMITMVSEVVILLGVASLIGWNLDMASIAGILVAVGTGVDDQIVITDETLKGESMAGNWKERLKRAFFIIFAAYFTMVVAMIPLLFAGAGLLKGFAITSIIGVSVGVFVTRPAYAAIVERLTTK